MNKFLHPLITEELMVSIIDHWLEKVKIFQEEQKGLFTFYFSEETYFENLANKNVLDTFSEIFFTITFPEEPIKSFTQWRFSNERGKVIENDGRLPEPLESINFASMSEGRGASEETTSTNSDIELECPPSPRHKPLRICLGVDDELLWIGTGLAEGKRDERKRAMSKSTGRIKVSVMKFLDRMSQDD